MKPKVKRKADFSEWMIEDTTEIETLIKKLSAKLINESLRENTDVSVRGFADISIDIDTSDNGPQLNFRMSDLVEEESESWMYPEEFDYYGAPLLQDLKHSVCLLERIERKMERIKNEEKLGGPNK